MNGFPDPIEILMKEHEDGLKRLSELGGAAEYINANGFSFAAYSEITGAIRFINSEIRKHNEKEEKFLFPLMDRHADRQTIVMRNEHRELWKLFNRLLESVEDVEEGRIHPTTIRELVQSSKSLVELLTEHIRKENDLLFPMAKRMLTETEYEQLRQDIARETVATS